MSRLVPVFRGRVTPQGRLLADDGADLQAHLQRLAGQIVDITVKLHKSQRSTNQNRYYFGVVVRLMSEHTGYEPDEMHEALAFKFLRIEDCPLTGTPRRKRTPKTDTAEFATYLDQCIRFAASLGLVIPDADTVTVDT